MHSVAKVSLENNRLNTAFVVDGITSLGYRVDGRAFGQRRPLSFDFGTKDSSVVVRLGKTVVTACVAARIEAPMYSRMNEGSLRCIVRDATFLSGKKQSGSQRELLQMYERFLDRSFKESKAVDMESLCIQSGKYVWYVEVQLTVMNDDGNVLDALGWAVLAALRVFLRNEVEVRGKGHRQGENASNPVNSARENGPLKIYGLDAREGVGMTLHHFPVVVTFAVFEKEGESPGTCVLVDPTAVEETAASGHMTISITPQGELCAVQKADGCGMDASEVFGCMRRGMELAKEGCDVLDEALKKHAVDRVAIRVKKHDRGQGGSRMDVDDAGGRRDEGIDVPEDGDGSGDRSRYGYGRDTPEDVREAILASQAAEEADEDDPLEDDAAQGTGTEPESMAVDELKEPKKKKTGRKYREGGPRAGKAVYKQASDAVVRKTARDGKAEAGSLSDALVRP